MFDFQSVQLDNKRSLSLACTVVEAFIEQVEGKISDNGMRKELSQFKKDIVAVAECRKSPDKKFNYALWSWWLKANETDPELVRYCKQQMGFIR